MLQRGTYFTVLDSQRIRDTAQTELADMRATGAQNAVELYKVRGAAGKNSICVTRKSEGIPASLACRFPCEGV